MISTTASSNSKNNLSAGRLRYGRLWTWLGILMVSSVIFLSLIDPPQLIKTAFTRDKLLHAVAYCALMGWFAQIFHHYLIRIWLVGLFIALGVGVEFLQGLLPTRDFDIFDMIANSFGVLLAWVLCHTWVGQILIWFERNCLPQPKYAG